MEFTQYYENCISVNVRKCFHYVKLYNNINLKEDMNMLEYSQKLSEIELNYKLSYNEIINKHTQLINLYHEIDYLNRIIQKKYNILYGEQEFNENINNEPEFYINI